MLHHFGLFYYKQTIGQSLDLWSIFFSYEKNIIRLIH